MRTSIALIAALLSLSLTGCHYRVTSSDTGDVYYTNDWWKAWKARNSEKTITFEEEITGDIVTLQSPGVERVSWGTYREEVSAIKEWARQPRRTGTPVDMQQPQGAMQEAEGAMQEAEGAMDEAEAGMEEAQGEMEDPTAGVNVPETRPQEPTGEAQELEGGEGQ